MKSTLLAVAVLAAYLLPGSHATPAQGVGASADLTGTVTDPTGAGVPKAKVTATDPGKGVERSAMTDEHGFYRVSGLPPSSYKVSVEHAGFQTEIAAGVVLTVGQTLVFDLRLKLSGMSSQVEVSAESPVVETERGSQANTLTQTYIADLPIDRRKAVSPFTAVTAAATASPSTEARPMGIRVAFASPSAKTLSRSSRSIAATTARTWAVRAAPRLTLSRNQAPTKCMEVSTAISVTTQWTRAIPLPSARRCNPAKCSTLWRPTRPAARSKTP